ncbi:M16 family metallopeptidase [Desulfallas thermosapovorans]|uniref:Putative Zn-dependent peptidase n=1 Tax=Desulfallas thermosapovorans DSM 6562 TaxID=1121431 RepID=A0A5S4ZYR7_9FIRM|nr:pitrilysin family protein [Desulfallas thermosapovorans]TYO97879.1 putative Zn-dependent peptidase [Desulfallas thermosapovorans DSM 6562]
MIQVAELANGIKVLTENIPHVRSVAIGVWVDIGSRDESNELAGISHFIEHLMFKGTSKRTAKDIAEALDAVGGQLNAFTTKEYTCYYARVLDEHLSLGVELLGDMLLHSRFDQVDIDRERNVILEEIKMYEDAPDELVHDVFAGTIWQSHPLGRPIIGYEKIVQGLSREQIISFYQKYYSPGNMVVSVAGNIDHQQVIGALNDTFGKLTGAKKERLYTLPEPARRAVCRTKDTEQVHICLGTPGLALDNEKIYVFQIINTILGGGLSSRLFQEIREQRGLVYSIYSYHSSYHDSGLFCIYTGLSKQNVRSTLELIIKEIYSIQSKGVSPPELQRAKDQLKGNLLLSLESISTRMSRLGKSQMYLGKVVSPDEIVNRIMAVSDNDIKELARTVLKPENFCLASVGPWDDGDILREIVGKG